MLNQKTNKWRQENRDKFNERTTARYHARKIEWQVIGKETELNADHVKVVMARWPHGTEREALQYLYPKEVQYLWIKGQIGNNQ